MQDCVSNSGMILSPSCLALLEWLKHPKLAYIPEHKNTISVLLQRGSVLSITIK